MEIDGGRDAADLQIPSKHSGTSFGMVSGMNETTGSHQRRCSADRPKRRPGERGVAGTTRGRRRRSAAAVAMASPDGLRLLTTVLFADVAGSTELVDELGDAHWRRLLADFYDTARRLLRLGHGTEVVTTGDGLLATFAAPGGAVRYGQELQRAMRAVGLPVRVGVHTAEVEVLGDDIAGVGVHIGARVAALSDPGEVWVTRTVRDVVAGSDLRFEDRGTHQLRGLTHPWELHAAVEPGPAR